MVNIQDSGDNPAIRLELGENIATLSLNRPDKKNAVTYCMWRDLATFFGQIGENRAIRVVILRGAGADFCAGADIDEFDEVRRDAATARGYESANDDAFAAIRNCPVPVIAAIRGVCFGGGFGIAAAADIRIGAPDASFAVPAARLGLAYPVKAMADIVDAVGAQAAKYLTFSAGRMDAKAALTNHFLLEIIDTDRLDDHVAALAATIAANAPLSVRASKAAIRAALSGFPYDVEVAEQLGRLTFDSSDYSEGRAAFAARRKPDFKGQ